MSKSGQLLIDAMDKSGPTAYWISLWSITSIQKCPQGVGMFSKRWKISLPAGHKNMRGFHR